MSLLNLLFNQTAIPYNPKLNDLTDNTLGSILFQQILYWYGKSRQPFYKFMAPCEHRLYQEGDSWLEELRWKRSEFETARDSIATKIISTQIDDFCSLKVGGVIRPFQQGILYWTTGDRVTYYTLNEELLEYHLNKLFTFIETPKEKPDLPRFKLIGAYEAEKLKPKTGAQMSPLENYICSLSGAKSLTQAYASRLNTTITWYDPRSKQQKEQSVNELYRDDPIYKIWIETKCIPDLSRFKQKQSGKIGTDKIITALMTLSNYTYFLNNYRTDIITTEKSVEW